MVGPDGEDLTHWIVRYRHSAFLADDRTERERRLRPDQLAIRSGSKTLHQRIYAAARHKLQIGNGRAARHWFGEDVKALLLAEWHKIDPVVAPFPFAFRADHLSAHTPLRLIEIGQHVEQRHAECSGNHGERGTHLQLRRRE